MISTQAHNASKIALEVLKECCSSGVFFASALNQDGNHYASLWTRDFCYSLFGVIASNNIEIFKQPIINSFDLIFKYQLPNGQLPNNLDLWNKSEQPKAFYQSIDSTVLALLAIFLLKPQINLTDKFKHQIMLADSWLQSRDTSQSGLLEQQETTDWLDTIPNQGNVLATNILYYLYLKSAENPRLDLLFKSLKTFFNQSQYEYLYPWVWKVDHGNYCDSLGNCLALIINLVSSDKKDVLIRFLLKQSKQPYPTRAIMPPIKKESQWWRRALEISESSQEFCYQNGGIWPFIGGWFVLALVAQEKFDDAEQALNDLAVANIQDPNHFFPEWLDGKSGQPKGKAKQAWSAGMYLVAYQAVIKNNFIKFL